mgnify:CR=1 FL=1
MASRDRLTVFVLFHNLGGSNPLARECLASLAHSVDDRIRFELIDDGSTDDTPQLLAEAARRLPGASVHTHASARGASAARNGALTRVETTWFTFLDGDDWVRRGYYPALLDEAERTGVPWLRVDHIATTGKERLVTRIPSGARGRVIAPREEILPGHRTTPVDFAHSWGGLYHRCLADEQIWWFPPQLRTAEDRPGIWNLHLSVDAYAISEVCGLHYRRGIPTSLTMVRDERQLDIIESMRLMGEVVARHDDTERFAPKVVRTWAGLFAFHYLNRHRLSPALRRRFMVDADALLATAPQELLAEVLTVMPESRRQSVQSLRRQAAALRATGMRPTPTPPSATWGSTTGLENVDQVRIDG